MTSTARHAIAALTLFATACGGGRISEESLEEDAPLQTASQAILGSSDSAYFYDGPLPMLENPSVTLSLRGATVRVSGLLPVGYPLAQRPPHAKLKDEGDRTRIHLVYPTAVARQGLSNSTPGTYHFFEAYPYSPDGPAYTVREGWHQVPWGGFPYLGYNGGIAMHGPITQEVNALGQSVWYLRRGGVSGGCNRFMGEHIVEVAHLLGNNMREVYVADERRTPPRVPVTVIADYDQLDGMLIDVDYPTDDSANPVIERPQGNVRMFGSWTSTGGYANPRKWEGGVPGKWYDYAQHAKPNWVCRIQPELLPTVRAIANHFGGVLPQGFCEHKGCIMAMLDEGSDPLGCF